MTVIPGIGSQGLRKLQSSEVTIVGVGGVGSAVAYYLVQAGVGHLTLIDQDIVEPSNLHRLPELDPSSLYHPKAEAIANSLQRRIPSVNIEPIIETLRSANASELLKRSDVLVDGLDNFRTRYLLNDYSVRTSTPYVFAAAIQNQGHVGVFHPPTTPCLECRFPNVVDETQDSCETLGVTPTTTGLVGAFAANETIKILLSSTSSQLSKLMTVDSLIPNLYSTEIQRRSDCETCGKTRNRHRELENETPAVLCGGKTFNLLPRKISNIDLRRAASLVPQGSRLFSTERVLVYRQGRATISLFGTGRVLVDGVETMDEAVLLAGDALQLADGSAVPIVS